MTEVKVFLAGEHEGISKEARQEAWERIYREKLEKLGTLSGRVRNYRYSKLEGALIHMFENRETSNRYSDNLMGYDEKCYGVDIVFMLLQAIDTEEGGQITGDILVRDTRHWLLGMKRMVMRVQIVTPDPLSVEMFIKERMGRLETVYPKYIADSFSIKVEIVQPISENMVEIEEGLGHVKAIEEAV